MYGRADIFRSAIDMANELDEIHVTLHQILGSVGDGKTSLEMIEILRSQADQDFNTIQF